MAPFRLLVANLVLASLLLGDVAVWLHHPGCGSGDAPTATCDGGATVCCAASHPSPGEGEADDALPADEHDSDACTICRWLATAKIADALPVLVVAAGSEAPQVLAVSAQCLLSPLDLSGTPHRGPPVRG